MISFRLTAEEYGRFRELCDRSKGRSVSEMARAAINMMFEEPRSAQQPSIQTRVSELEERLQVLVLEVRRLQQSASRPDRGGVVAGLENPGSRISS